MRPTSWVPPVLWMALILWLASDAGSAEHTSRLVGPLLRVLFPAASPLQIQAMHGVVRKLGHLSEYAVLAGLWVRALARDTGVGRRSAAWRAWIIAVAWAVMDESYQSTIGSRTGSGLDVGLDAAGALAAAVPYGYGWRASADRLTGAVLWTAAVGGAVLLVINAAAGVESGVLWATVPAAAVVLGLRRRRRRAPPPATP